VLAPGALIGTTAISVLGHDREVEEQPAMTLWAARTGAVRSVRLDALRTGDGIVLLGLEDIDLASTATMILLADPMSFPIDDVVEAMAHDAPHVQIVGGMASAGFAPGANRLIIDDRAYDDGAVAVLLGADQVVTTVVSQGCRPIGIPLVVTKAERNLIQELAGQPALDRLDEIFQLLPEHERELVQRGLHIGRVIDEHKLDFGRGDFLVRNVIGADRATGAIAIGDIVEVGTTVQFHVRDAGSADEDMRELLAGQHGDAALVFTCNGRGIRLFGRPDHDAEIVDRVVDGITAGMFCAGEIGPVGARNFMHGFTASIALFSDPA
jgi:small ligand-binding sensory domain FIST